MRPALESFETARLRAERVRPEHLDAFHALRADPRVAEWLGGPRTRTESEAALATELEHWDCEGFGVWAWFDRENGAFVARAGLRRLEVDDREEIEIAYAVVAERWGEGLATEIARAIVRVGFDGLGLDDLVAFTLPDNLRSRRVMEKAGLTYERDVVFAGLPHVLYRIRSGSSSDG
jgi:ribosomal-protein-alanine N-acetyltransferase